jgi:hypothetical protein
MGHLLAEGKEVAWMPFHQSVPDDFNPHIHYSVAFLGLVRGLFRSTD